MRAIEAPATTIVGSAATEVSQEEFELSLVSHLESHLGRIDQGWKETLDGEPLPFQVVMYEPGNFKDAVAFSTLGLSDIPLADASGHLIRHEFMMVVPDEFQPGPIPGLIQQVALEVLHRETPLLAGETIGPYGQMFDDSLMEAIYAAPPVLLPDEFGAYGDIAIAWLLPIAKIEYEAIQEDGWQYFEECLLKVDVDLIDVWRWPIFKQQ